MANQYVSFEGTATATPQQKVLNSKDILYVANDSPTVKLYISFEDNVTDDYIPILPGEKLDEFPPAFSARMAWYKTTSGTADFRFFGGKTR